MSNRVILWVAVLGVMGFGCRKEDASKRGAKETAGPAAARPSAEVAPLIRALVLSAPEKERFEALEKLVKGWPRTRGALPAALGLVVADSENRGGLAMSLARLGRPLVPALNQMTAQAPLHLPTLRAAGVLAYHLVVRSGLTKRSDAELAALRQALLPTVKRITAAFFTDPLPEYEIYQGVAVGAQETIQRLGPPIAAGGLTRVAMVLYLILTNRPNEALLPAADRARLRQQALPLAKPFAEALPRARAFDGGESPDSLMLGLSVLGAPAARALAAVPDMSKQKGCVIAIKATQNLLDQFPVSAAAALRPLLHRCQKLKWSHAPNVPPALQQVLARLAGKAPAPAPRPAPGMAAKPAHDHGHEH